MAEKEMICILCPLGCKMQAEEKTGEPGELSVRGQQCKLGKKYAYEEYYDPQRTLTSTVVVHGGVIPRLPVKTDRPIPKDLVREAVRVIAGAEVDAPVAIGAIIIRNLLGTGANVVATRSLG